MFGRSCIHKVAIFLLPALLTFSVQWSLEVFHPIEERNVAVGHEHSDGGASVYDPSGCAVYSHSSHFCSHSNAYARALQLTSTARLGAHRATHNWLSETPSIQHFIDFSVRGPPILG